MAIDTTNIAFAARGVERPRGKSRRALRNPGQVLIGLIDYGFDLLHPSVLDDNGRRSLFAALCDQNARPGAGLLTAAEINELIHACVQQQSRSGLDRVYDPHANYYDPQFAANGGQGGAHGTLMASIAAGRQPDDLSASTSPCGLMGVQLALQDADWKEQTRSGVPTWTSWRKGNEPVWAGWKSYGDQPQIADAIDTLWAQACELNATALVINLSLGAFAGAHDGHSLVERKISTMSARSLSGERPLTALVLASGNGGNRDGHFATTLQPFASQALTWMIDPRGLRQSKLEIWYEPARADTPPLEIRLSAPGSAAGWPVAPGKTVALELAGRRIGIADHVIHASGSRSRVRFLLHPPYFPGNLAGAGRDADFQLDLKLAANAGPVDLHAWIEREDHASCHASLSPATSEGTLSGLCGGDGAIIVGAQDTTACDAEPVAFAPSGAGPLPWVRGLGARAPHICAPGHRIAGACSKTQGFSLTSGSSPAAARVSGDLARRLNATVLASRKADLSASQTRAQLQATIDALSDPRSRRWHPKLGYGPLDLVSPTQMPNAREDRAP